MTDTYINVYRLEDRYGGPEEGDWWYDVGYPFLSLKVEEHDRAVDIQDTVWALRQQWQDNGNRRSSLYERSESKPTDYRVLIEDHPAREWPEERPRYE